MTARPESRPVALWKIPMRGLLLAIYGMGLIGGCSSEDMHMQPSFSYQEAPRRHSPEDSVPRPPTAYAPKKGKRQVQSQQARRPQGATIYAINCSHCHGSNGKGDGAVAGYLKNVPANLQDTAVQNKPASVLVQFITHGLDVMPAFRPYLTTEERKAVADFILTLHSTQPEGNSEGNSDENPEENRQ